MTGPPLSEAETARERQILKPELAVEREDETTAQEVLRKLDELERSSEAVASDSWAAAAYEPPSWARGLVRDAEHGRDQARRASALVRRIRERGAPNDPTLPKVLLAALPPDVPCIETILGGGEFHVPAWPRFLRRADPERIAEIEQQLAELDQEDKRRRRGPGKRKPHLLVMGKHSRFEPNGEGKLVQRIYGPGSTIELDRFEVANLNARARRVEPIKAEAPGVVMIEDAGIEDSPA
jgi:hypothetical protein